MLPVIKGYDDPYHRDVVLLFLCLIIEIFRNGFTWIEFQKYASFANSEFVIMSLLLAGGRSISI